MRRTFRMFRTMISARILHSKYRMHVVLFPFENICRRKICSSGTIVLISRLETGTFSLRRSGLKLALSVVRHWPPPTPALRRMPEDSVRPVMRVAERQLDGPSGSFDSCRLLMYQHMDSVLIPTEAHNYQHADTVFSLCSVLPTL